MLWFGGMNLATGESRGGLLCHDCDKALRARQPITWQVNAPEQTPDGDAQVWLLFSPGLFTLTPALHDWTTPCQVFTSQLAATGHLAALLGEPLASSLRWEQHPLFPELAIGTDSRGYRWLLVSAPVDAGVGR
jgi:hypothetical protein